MLGKENCLQLIALILLVFVLYLYMRKQRILAEVREGQARRSGGSSCGR